MRVLGIDLGDRRIGVAVSDRDAVLATPHDVVERANTSIEDYCRLAEVATELGVGKVVIGVPTSLDGASGTSAKKIMKQIEELRGYLPVPVEVIDERFTTVIAHKGLATLGRNAKQRRSEVDATAAAVLLQDWLDRQ